MSGTGTPGAQQTQRHDCPFGCGPVNDESTVGGPGFALIPACPVHGWVCELLDQSAARLTTAEQERDANLAEVKRQQELWETQSAVIHRLQDGFKEQLRLGTAEIRAERDELKAIVVRGNVWDTAEQNRILGTEARMEAARQETYDERVQWQKFAVESEDRARAAEAHVEAAEQRLTAIVEYVVAHPSALDAGRIVALACPPQQRGEK